MPLFMYQQAIPPLLHFLTNLKTILNKASAYREEKEIGEGVLESSRLFPDMFPLTRQVQIATDVAKGCGARLSQTEPLKLEDNETGFEALIERVQKTIDYLQTFTPDQFDNSDEREIELKTPKGTLNFTGANYLNYFVLPNVYFHITTAYAILRTSGVGLSKMDYLNPPNA